MKIRFYPALKINVLIDLHNDLSRDFEILEHNFIKIGDIFQKYEKRFYEYCHIVAKVDELRNFLEEKSSFNLSIRDELDTLWEQTKSATNTNSPYFLEELLQMIPQHLMRFEI